MSDQNELDFRLNLIEAVINYANAFDGTLSRVQLRNFIFEGTLVSLADRQRGIWNPGINWPFSSKATGTISISTTLNSPYKDDVIVEGLWRYDYQANTTEGSNTKLRDLLHRRMPLLWLVQQQNRKYIPYEVYVVDDNIKDKYFLIAPDLALAEFTASDSEIERRYAQRLIKQRLHQPRFRHLVLNAYQVKCAVCALSHGELLDAAHITPDSDPNSSAEVSNGISMCKIHHAAYDRNLLGINANYQIFINDRLLNEVDGPMLKHGLQAMHKKIINLPNMDKNKPDRERLDSRYRKFQVAV